MALFNTHFTSSLLVSIITLSVVTAHIDPSFIFSDTTTKHFSANTFVSYLPEEPFSYSTATEASAPAPAVSISPAPAPAPSPASSEPNEEVPSEPESVPADEKARDQKYLEAHMKKAANDMEQFLNNVVKGIMDSNTEITKECLDVCAEVYDGAVEAMKKGIESIGEDDFFKAQMDVSAFLTNIDTCDDCLGGAVDSELQKIDNWASGVGGDCLDKIAKYTPNPGYE